MQEVGRMMQLHRYIDLNRKVIVTLIRQGYTSTKLLRDHEIYIAYTRLSPESKMNRYRQLSDMFKVSSVTVRQAVTSMKGYVKCL